MNTQNFNQQGGFPIETETLDEMQTAYLLMQKFGYLAGDFSIISGCEVSGGIVADGSIFVAGELLEFKGGNVGTTVIIVETITTNEFEDATEKDVLFKRYATFGAGVNAIPWANFKRCLQTRGLAEIIALKEDKTNIELLIDRIELLEARPPSNVPIGMIAIWDLPLAQIPTGWVEYLPLRGRTPVGLNPDYVQGTDLINYNLENLGSTGGVRQHQLTIDEMPSHRLKLEKQMPKPVGDSDRGSNPSNFSLDTPEDVYTEYIGNDKAHTNMSPYRIVHYIKYTG